MNTKEPMPGNAWTCDRCGKPVTLRTGGTTLCEMALGPADAAGDRTVSNRKTKRYVAWILPSASSHHVDAEVSDAVEVPDGEDPHDHAGMRDELQELIANHIDCGIREARDDE